MRVWFLSITLASFAFVATPTTAENLYVFIDAAKSDKVNSGAFAGATSGETMIAPALKQSGIGVSGGVGLVFSRNLSIEASYFELSKIHESTPGGLRDIPTDSGDLEYSTALTLTPYGYRIRLRYFKPMGRKLDFTASTGWQVVNYKMDTEHDISELNSSNYSLVHSAGFSYAIKPQIVIRTEYHFHQRFINLTNNRKTDMSNITVGFEFFF